MAAAGARPGRKATTGSSWGEVPGGAWPFASSPAPIAWRTAVSVPGDTSRQWPATSWYPMEMPQSCMGLSLPQRPGLCVPFGQKDVGIQDSVGIEGPFDGPEDVNLLRAAVEVQPWPLGRADAVLGADAAAEAGHEPQHGVLHRA